MSYESMSWWSACLQDSISCYMFCFTGRHFLLDDMFYLRVCIIEGMSYSSCCFTGIHVLQEGIFYWMIHHIGKHLYEDRFFWTVCIRGSHVLHKGMSCRWTCPAEVHVVWVDMYFRNICFNVGMSYGRHIGHEVMFYRMACYAGEHILLEDLFCCGHVFHENIYCGRTCLVGGHALQVCAYTVII